MDDEFNFYDDLSKKRNQTKAGVHDHNSASRENLAKYIVTPQEQCQFCFENLTRPRRLDLSIGKFSYMMLPPWQPVVQGHCCIVPMQHESATRNIDKRVWDEIRNFMKCLIVMFAKQGKDLLFLETVMGPAQQRRHCLVECIPLPREIAKQAPLYFKKAIDETKAKDGWCNKKKLIDTIPENFPYFQVDFGLNGGFVHIIDDEEHFKSNFGLEVVRRMLCLPGEDVSSSDAESVEAQKKAEVASFCHAWDWTKEHDCQELSQAEVPQTQPSSTFL